MIRHVAIASALFFVVVWVAKIIDARDHTAPQKVLTNGSEIDLKSIKLPENLLALRNRLEAEFPEPGHSFRFSRTAVISNGSLQSLEGPTCLTCDVGPSFSEARRIDEFIKIKLADEIPDDLEIKFHVTKPDGRDWALRPEELYASDQQKAELDGRGDGDKPRK